MKIACIHIAICILVIRQIKIKLSISFEIKAKKDASIIKALSIFYNLHFQFFINRVCY